MLLSDYRLSNHEYWMRYALKLAKHAWNIGEIPVGAVLVYDNHLISQGWNNTINLCDPTAHAEIIALRHGSIILKNYRLLNTILYVTLEPCIMCFGALINSRIHTLIYGSSNNRTKIVDTLSSYPLKEFKFNHKINILNGILETECSMLLSTFFRIRRKQKLKDKT